MSFFYIVSESMTALQSPEHPLVAERHLLLDVVGMDGPAVDQAVVIALLNFL